MRALRGLPTNISPSLPSSKVLSDFHPFIHVPFPWVTNCSLPDQWSRRKRFKVVIKSHMTTQPRKSHNQHTVEMKPYIMTSAVATQGNIYIDWSTGTNITWEIENPSFPLYRTKKFDSWQFVSTILYTLVFISGFDFSNSLGNLPVLQHASFVWHW